MPNPFCEALKLGDVMVCLLCTLSWEVEDPMPPPCEFETNQSAEEKQS